MANKSNNQGRAYEYAWIQTLYDTLSKIRKTEIDKNSSYLTNKRAWDSLDTETQDMYMLSARAALDKIINLDPIIIEDDGDVLYLQFQRDEVGVEGDVRDILIIRGLIDWKIGLSIKHNHEAVKHSRLSSSLDFGREWYDIPCSNEYWTDVSPVFERLKRDREAGINWSDLDDKVEGVYLPLLNAFIDEVNRAYKKDHDLPKKMTEYLIGKEDYYKVVSHDKKRLTLIYVFNIHGSLNKREMNHSAECLNVTSLPTELIYIGLKPNKCNCVEMEFDNNWKLSFRIHNASTRVEPSLKFDIEFDTMPDDVLRIECKWE